MRSSQVWLLVPILVLACDGDHGPTVALAPGPASEAATPTLVADVGPSIGVAMPMPGDGPEANAPGPKSVADAAIEPSAIAEPRREPRGESRRPTKVVLLSSAEVLATVESVLSGEEDRPSDVMWSSRAADAIGRDPKLREQIADRLIFESSTTAGREFGVTILAKRGTSQAALRRVLTAPEVRADPQYYLLVVQLLSMPRPEDETVELVYSLRASEELMTRRIATTVLGGQIGALHAVGQTDAALKLAKRLQADFKGSSDLQERASILESIGRGSLPQTRAFVRRFARSKQPELRIAAAKGMLLDDTTKGVALLLALSVDRDPEVQTAAVDSLHLHTLNKREQRTLHRAIMSDRLEPTNDGVLVYLIAKRLVGTARTEALEHLLARHDETSWVRRHIVDALAR